MNMTWGPVYWPWWLAISLSSLLGGEIFALITDGKHLDNTLSEWVRTTLHIVKGENIFQWNAADILTFCAYVSIFIVWLPYHFWWRKFG